MSKALEYFVRYGPVTMASAAAAHLSTMALFPDSLYARATSASRFEKSLPYSHPLAKLARETAAELEAYSPEAVKVVIVPEGEDPHARGSFLPARLWRARDKPSVVISLPEDYLDRPADFDVVRLDGQEVDAALVVPSDADVRFALSHEISHAKHEDHLFHAIVSPSVMLGVFMAASRMPVSAMQSVARSSPAPHLAILTFAGLAIGSVVVSWVQEFLADADAAVHGFAHDGAETIERHIRLNQTVKHLRNDPTILSNGDYLLDVMHPTLSMRLRLLHHFDSAFAHH